MAVALLALPRASRADDSAASVAAGGIRLIHQRGIAMRSERLVIGLGRVRVDYEFVNETSRDITTEVAFPMPPATAAAVQGASVSLCCMLNAASFQLWVNGRPKAYQTASKAMLHGRDYSTELKAAGVDPLTFAGLANAKDPTDEPAPQIGKLRAAVRRRLERARLVDRDGVPTWTELVWYHWKQTFPAHRIVRIRHQYRPRWGGGFDLDASAFRAPYKGTWDAGFPADACISPALARTLARYASAIPGSNATGYSGAILWVDFILKTANNWRRPIGKFDLIIEEPPLDPTRNFRASASDRVSFSVCWPGPWKPLGPHRFVSTINNFVPAHDLHVVFFDE